MKVITLLKLCPYVFVPPTGLWLSTGQGTGFIGLCIPAASHSASITHQEMSWLENKSEGDGCRVKYKIRQMCKRYRRE